MPVIPALPGPDQRTASNVYQVASGARRCAARAALHGSRKFLARNPRIECQADRIRGRPCRLTFTPFQQQLESVIMATFSGNSNAVDI